MKPTQIVAHRGFSFAAPENTLSAFRLAVEADADGIELDVHLTKDGEIVVMHDEMVDRTTDGQGWIKDLTLAEIKRLDSGSWFSGEFAEERVPTLGEVLEQFEHCPLWLNIELKNNVICYSRLEEKVVREVERFGWADRVVLSTFNHYSLRGMAQFRPNWSLAALYEYGLFAPWNYAKSLGVSAIHPFHLVATPEVIAGCKRHGIAVRPYTVDEPCEMERLIEAGAEAIITNVPDRLRRLFLSGECS